jgi:hypothetical protein
MNTGILDFFMHLRKKSKLGRYMLNLSRRSLKIKWMVLIRWCVALILNDDGVHDHMTKSY